MLKTFANKYRTKTRKIKKKYFRDGRFTVIYKTKSGMKESVFYRGPFIRKDKPNVPQADILPAYKRYDRPNRIAAKLRSKTCELCGQYTNDVEIHQVKRLKSLSGEYEWEKVMLKNRRKTLAVCPACHREIHGKD
ncbi:HNH endonuclease signature motif containing protein [Acutalibacter sp. JLR.KK004]